MVFHSMKYLERRIQHRIEWRLRFPVELNDNEFMPADTMSINDLQLLRILGVTSP